MRSKMLFFILMLILIKYSFVQGKEDVPLKFSDNLGGLEELLFLDCEVVTTSKSSEKLSETPATVIVISKKDIQGRGYRNITDVLNDLPGMDNSPTDGDDYFKNYWRGYRTTITAGYLLLLDGVEFNQLGLNMTDIFATFPISNIDRIEVVYGPSSSIYGANAFTGVLNIITKNDADDLASTMKAMVTRSDKNYSIADVNTFFKYSNIKFSISARMENGNSRDKNVYNNFEYTKDKYYSDPKLWGKIIDNSSLGGQFDNPIHNKGLDIRAFFGNTELAIQYFDLTTGYGYEYPGDKAQNNAVWSRVEQSYYLRHNTKITDNIESKTLFRYRISDIPAHSFFLESYSSGGIQGVDFSYWQYQNSSLSFFQDYNFQVNDKLSFLAGLKYESKDLQKAYDTSYGPFLSADIIDAGTYSYPEVPSDIYQYKNRFRTEDAGGYLQGKITLFDNQNIHIGGRVDRNSEYGTNTTMRTGYVLRMGNLVSKILYGEAYQAPTARQLYAGWAGTGYNPSLKPEQSNTIEINLNYEANILSHMLSIYKTHNTDTIKGSINVGECNVHGLDYQIQAQVPNLLIKQLKLWGYFSYIKGDQTTNGITTDIGDIAPQKVFLGTTLTFNDKWMATLKGRYIAKTDLVDTNPLKTNDRYFLADLHVAYDVTKNFGFSLSVDNLFDKKYFSPGTRTADSGDAPGIWNGNVWNGSTGWFSSLIPGSPRVVWVALNYKN